MQHIEGKHAKDHSVDQKIDGASVVLREQIPPVRAHEDLAVLVYHVSHPQEQGIYEGEGQVEDSHVLDLRLKAAVPDVAVLDEQLLLLARKFLDLFKVILPDQVHDVIAADENKD